MALRHNIFSDKVLKEIAGKKTVREDEKAKEIAETHTIDTSSMTLILGRVEELYRVASKLNSLGLTAAAVEIEESISEIEKAILSSPVVKEESPFSNNEALRQIMELQRYNDLTNSPDVNIRPIGTPLIQDGGSGDVIWEVRNTSGTPMHEYSYGNPGTPMVGYSMVTDTTNRNENDYTEAMRRAYERLGDIVDRQPTPTRLSDPDYDE